MTTEEPTVIYRIVVKEEAKGKSPIEMPQDLALLTVATGKLEDVIDITDFAHPDGTVYKGIIAAAYGEPMRAILTPYDFNALIFGCDICEVVADFGVAMQMEGMNGQ